MYTSKRYIHPTSITLSSALYVPITKHRKMYDIPDTPARNKNRIYRHIHPCDIADAEPRPNDSFSPKTQIKNI